MSRMSYVKRSEVITEEGYRLSPFLLRMAACLVDVAFFVGSFVLIFFLLSTNSFTTLIDAMGSRDAQNKMSDYQINSGLVSRNEKNVLADISSDTYYAYEDAVVFYYLDYESGNNKNNPEPLNFTVYDYNKTILGLPESDEYVNHSSYYEYQKDAEGNSLLNERAVLKESLYDEETHELTKDAMSSLLTFYRDAYSSAQDKLMSRPYYKEAQATLNKGYIVVESIAAYVPFLIFYFIIPITNVPGQTLGKKFMKIAVAESRTGVAVEKWRTSLRTIPFLVVSLIAIIFNDLIVSLTTIILVMLVSSALMVFTKKRRCLHDYIAGTVVIREDDLMVRRIKKNPEENADAQAS